MWCTCNEGSPFVLLRCFEQLGVLFALARPFGGRLGTQTTPREHISYPCKYQPNGLHLASIREGCFFLNPEHNHIHIVLTNHSVAISAEALAKNPGTSLAYESDQRDLGRGAD